MKQFNDLAIRVFPFVFIVLLWGVFSSPFLFKNQVPYPSAQLVNNYGPWNNIPSFRGPQRNNAMPDVITQVFPWRHLVIESYKQKELPLWNPYSFAGNPLAANYQSAAFTPFNLLFIFFSFTDAWSIVVLLQPLVAGIGMYLFMRKFPTSALGSLISSTSFMFCGFITVWMEYGTLAMAAAMIPWIFLGVVYIQEKKRLLGLFISSLALSTSFLSGHFQTSLYVLFLSLGYAAYWFSQNKNVKCFLISLCSFICGLIVSLIQILPTIQLYLQSIRSGDFIKEGGIPIWYLVTFFIPDYFGNPVTRNDWIGHYGEWAGFIGGVSLLLSLMAIVVRKHKSVHFFAVAGTITLLLALAGPIQSLISILHIPVLSTSYPSRIIILFCFCFAVLAGVGGSLLQTSLSKIEVKKLLIILVVVGVLFGVIWAGTFNGVLPVDKIIIAKRNLLFSTGIMCMGVGIILASIFIKSSRIKTGLLLLLLLVCTADSFRFSQKWVPFESKDTVYPSVPVLSAIQRNIGYGRIYGSLGNETASYYGFPSLEGYDPLYIGRYGEFIRAADKHDENELIRSVVTLPVRGENTDKLLNFLGVSLLYHPISHTNQGWAYPVWERNDVSRIYQDDTFQLFKNDSAMNRVALFCQFEVITEDKKILDTFYKNTFDYTKTLLLEKQPSFKTNTDCTASGSASIISYTPNNIKIEVNSPSKAILLLTDNYYSGWRAMVNGKTTEIYRADYTFRAVEIPQGHSRVEFAYSLL